ncbi:hypothetical protein T05_10315 [Trichinella murrelli]|uniref:Uncharacterized protein n=1 Tax=Trichinella murrelli TaxID=144512 RepID=A0A0V0TJC0_9BILA|nr:hypothetical protein T05_10902 [Trichinella murrelli]KRX39098.1 hypothetical protein T05_10315 [Trichinella murrelli]
MFKFAFGLFYISILGVNSTFTTTGPGGFSGCNYQINRVGLKFCEIYDFQMSIKIKLCRIFFKNKQLKVVVIEQLMGSSTN